MSAPAGLTSLTLLPGERADLVMDFAPYAPGTEITLTNGAPAPFPGSPGVGVVPTVMKFIVGSASGHTAPLPASLRAVETLPESSATVTREFVLRKQSDPCRGIRWTINGLGFDDITEFPQLGNTEIWSFINRSGVAHPMHIHLVLVQILDRQTFTTIGDSIVPTGPRILPLENERGWKETFRTDPNQITRVIMRFEDYEGLYPYHCHMLEHEDHEMMRQFRSVAPPTARPMDEPPVGLALRPVGPNPFHPPAAIEFELPAPDHVALRIYDAAGRVVRTLVQERLERGTYRRVWDGTDDRRRAVAAGLYFVRLTADARTLSRKMVLVR